MRQEMGEQRTEEASEERSWPKAAVRKRRSWQAVWIVPIVAALFVAGLFFREFRRLGPTIRIELSDGSGLRPRQTPVKYRGVTVGEVRRVTLADDGASVLVQVRLERSVARLAREGTEFWVVRPEIGFGNVSGLNTLISGSYLEMLPGRDPNGAGKREFRGLARPPLPDSQEGLKILLTAAQKGSLSAGSPVSYRGIEVGVVQAPVLNDNATGVTIPVIIKKPYAALVRTGSKFWVGKGIAVDFSLFKGAQINFDSLKSLMGGGGISFGTPPLTTENAPAADGAAFQLHDDPRKEWMEWSPSITLPK